MLTDKLDKLRRFWLGDKDASWHMRKVAACRADDIVLGEALTERYISDDDDVVLCKRILAACRAEGSALRDAQMDAS